MGNFLRGSITPSGLDPDNLPDADPTKMDFGTKEGSDSKAWKDIWGSGQGIGVLDSKRTTAELVEDLATQFEAAKKELDARLNTAVGVG
ncbi:MAG: nitronate monooxygenase, partial [Brevibacterium sp.]|nr:nitronate monooxygenase [Brevibacterium sp.]